MLKKMLYLAMLAVGLAACEKMPLAPEPWVYTHKVLADTLDAAIGDVEQARPHGKKIEF